MNPITTALRRVRARLFGPRLRTAFNPHTPGAHYGRQDATGLFWGPSPPGRPIRTPGGGYSFRTPEDDRLLSGAGEHKSPPSKPCD